MRLKSRRRDNLHIESVGFCSALSYFFENDAAGRGVGWRVEKCECCACCKLEIRASSAFRGVGMAWSALPLIFHHHHYHHPFVTTCTLTDEHIRRGTHTRHDFSSLQSVSLERELGHHLFQPFLTRAVQLLRQRFTRFPGTPYHSIGSPASFLIARRHFTQTLDRDHRNVFFESSARSRHFGFTRRRRSETTSSSQQTTNANEASASQSSTFSIYVASLQ